MTGSGTGDLMDLIVSNFKKESSEILDDDIPRFAVVGRPKRRKIFHCKCIYWGRT